MSDIGHALAKCGDTRAVVLVTKASEQQLESQSRIFGLMSPMHIRRDNKPRVSRRELEYSPVEAIAKAVDLGLAPGPDQGDVLERRNRFE